jgi:hypothetical protein
MELRTHSGNALFARSRRSNVATRLYQVPLAANSGVVVFDNLNATASSGPCLEEVVRP